MDSEPEEMTHEHARGQRSLEFALKTKEVFV